MIYINTFLYYFCFAAVPLFYGIGVTRTTQIDYFKSKSVLFFAKVFLTIIVTSILSWLITAKILIPLKIAELYPLIALLIMICVTAFFEAIIVLTSGSSTSEFVFTYLLILLCISESTSLLSLLIIGGSSFFSLLFLISTVFTFKHRVTSEEPVKEKYISRLLLFLAVLLFIISVWDIMWMNPEVIK